MPEIETAFELKRLLEAHGLSCVQENEWVVPNGELPAIRATWFPQEGSGRLDVNLLIANGVLVEECFAGIGSGVAGFRDALHSFMLNSLHVFLAAFWQKNDPQQVVTETWQVGKKTYTAYIGNFGTRASEGLTAPIPPDLFHAIEVAAKHEELSEDVHWIRTFFGNVAGQQTFEALLDNEDWSNGVKCLQSIPWEHSNGYYSIRNFILLRAL